MSVLGTIGSIAFPEIASTIDRYKNRAPGESKKAVFGKELLRAMFPTAYSTFSKQRTIKKAKAGAQETAVTEAVTVLAATVQQTNEIVTNSNEVQRTQNEILAQILNNLKNLKQQTGMDFDLPSVPDISRARIRPGSRVPKGTIHKSSKEAKKAGGGKYTDKKGRLQEVKKGADGKWSNRLARTTGAVAETRPAVAAAESKGFMASMKKFIKFVAIKGSKGLAARLAAKLTTMAAAAATGVGVILDIFLVAMSVYDAYELYQLWKEFQAAGEPDVPEVPEEANKQNIGEASKLFEQNGEEGKLLYGNIVTFQAPIISFTAREMIINAREIKNGSESAVNAADAADRATALAGPGGVGEHLGGPKNVVEGEPITGVPRMTRITSKSGKSTAVGEPYKEAFQGLIDDLESAGYKIKSLGGYDNRPNTSNPNYYSYHALGAAIDINASANPYGTTNTDLPQETGRFASARGLGWGMNWSSVKDPMHFSAAGKEGGKFNIPQVPIKRYEKGTNYVPSTGPAIVGEKGHELVIGKDGVAITPGQASVVNLNQGDKVIPAGVRPLTPLADTGPIKLPKFGRTGLIDQAMQNPTLKGGVEHVGEKNIIAKQGAIKEADVGTLAGAFYPKGFMGAKEGKIVYDESRGYVSSQQTLNHELRHAASTRMYTERLMNRDVGFVQGMLDKGYIDPKTGAPRPENPWQGVGEEARNRLTDLTVNKAVGQTGRDAAYDVYHMDKYLNQGLDMNTDSPRERSTVRDRRRGQLEDANKELDDYYSGGMSSSKLLSVYVNP